MQQVYQKPQGYAAPAPNTPLGVIEKITLSILLMPRYRLIFSLVERVTVRAITSYIQSPSLKKQMPINRTDRRRMAPHVARLQRIPIAIALLIPLVLNSCFTSNTAPRTPLSGKSSVQGKEQPTPNRPAKPTLSAKFSGKQLLFDWSRGAAADFYRLEENPDGISGYLPIVRNSEDTSYGYNITWRNGGWVNARFQLYACNAVGCTPSNELFVREVIADGIPPLSATPPEQSDFFGAAIALSNDGTTLAVGAPGKDGGNTSLLQMGAVYIYRFNETAWVQQAVLTPSSGNQNSRFGSALALSQDGDTLAVGAAWESRREAEKSGAVYLFSRNEGAWGKPVRLPTGTGGTEELCGYSVTLSGDGTVLGVGCPRDDSGNAATPTDDSATDSGGVYIYTRNKGDWQQHSFLKPEVITERAGFGGAITLTTDGTTIAVGADGYNGQEGAVYLFTRNQTDGRWQQENPVLRPSHPQKDALFGSSVALSSDGSMLAVGAPQEGTGTNDTVHRGAVYLFSRSEERWIQQARILATNGERHDEFGTSLGFGRNGALLAVGAPFEDSSATGINGNQQDDRATNSGAVYLYSKSEQGWKAFAYIKPNRDTAGDERPFGEFGTAVAVTPDGTILAAGAPHLASITMGRGEIGDTLGAPAGKGTVYLYSPPVIPDPE